MDLRKPENVRKIVTSAGIILLFMMFILPIFTLPKGEILDELTTGSLFGFLLLSIPFFFFWRMTKFTKSIGRILLFGTLLFLPLIISTANIFINSDDGQSGFIFIYALLFQYLVIAAFSVIRKS